MTDPAWAQAGAPHGLTREPRWPARMVFLTAWWLPATTARRTQHVPLARAFGVHLLATVLGCLLLWVLVAWEESGPDPGRTINVQLWRLLDSMTQEYFQRLARLPVETIAMAVEVILLVEGGFVALALLLAPWGAADERLRASAKHALRHTWLHTADVLPILLAVGLIAVPLSHALRAWNSQARIQYPTSLPSPPVRPPNLIVGSSAWQEYAKKQQEYTVAFDAYIRQQSALWEEHYASWPWYVRYSIRLGILRLTLTAAGIWALWAVMRAVGARRCVPPIVRPPTCEACGYDLTTISMEGRCPECGVPVLQSLGPAARPGACWERRRELGRLRAWRQTGQDAALRPTRLGMQVRVSAQVTDHRRFCILLLPSLFVIGYAAAIGFEGGTRHCNPFAKSLEVVYWLAPAFGGLAAAFGVVGPLLAAGVVGVVLSAGSRRNLLPAAMQVAAYSSAFLTFCVFLSAALAATISLAVKGDWLKGPQQWLHVDDEDLGFFCWAMLSFVLVLVYLALVYKGARAARHANR